MLENTAADTTRRHEDPCAMMRRTAKDKRDVIEDLTRRKSDVDEQIRRLQAEPNPDEAQIAELTQQSTHLELQIKSEEAQLGGLEAVISENC